MRLTLFFILLANLSFSQNFQSADNPYYWKNKTPEKSDYWQQDIDYTIDAKLDEKNEIISGTETIVYTNNSPDTLTELFFNLYQNAFIKNSYLSNLQKANGEKKVFGKWEAEGKGNEILSLKVDGIDIPKREIDGTIMRVLLPKPMVPNAKIKIDITFNTYYSLGGSTRRRMKMFKHQGKKHFNAAQWYPRLSVYDRKFGWTTDQHLGREFYGDFGDYKVSLDMPANFVVEATGVLQNRDEVLPKWLRDSLDLSRFWDNKWDSKVTYKIPSDSGARKTWTFLGENVHDFAWIAGPDYRIDEKEDKGVKAVAMVLEPHASGWKNACEYTLEVIDVYSRDFGQYAYPKMVVADAYDGMEYPMLTMDGGKDPSYRGLLAHEVGHNWFFGMVNNNETYRAMLDEGFTQFLTAWSQEAIDGPYTFNGDTNYMNQGDNGDLERVRDGRCYIPYLFSAIQGKSTPINVHSDGFDGATGHGGGYGQVYFKTATMLYNLQYVLGDSLFIHAMQNYFDEWSFRHPYVNDFKKSIIDYTKRDLNWFFDQWIDREKTLDYKVFKLKRNRDNTYKLKVKRLDDMQMPLDITVTGKSGKKYNFYIPNTWYQKETDAKVLPRWIGWDNNLKKVYETNISLPEIPKYLQIDTTYRLADKNQLNNSSRFPAVLKYSKKEDQPVDRYKYRLYWAPLVWYNNFDGVKLGVHFDGSYMKYFKNFEFDFWVNTTLGKSVIRPKEELYAYYSDNYKNDWVSFRFKYTSQLKGLMPNAYFSVRAQHLDGVALANFNVMKKAGKVWLEFGDKFLWKRTADQLNYDYRPSHMWNQNLEYNNSIYGKLDLNTNLGVWNQKLTMLARTSLISKVDYNYIEAESKNNVHTKYVDFRFRIYGRLGINNLKQPNEILLNAGGANAEEMIEDPFMRSVSFFPSLFTPGPELGITDKTQGKLHYSGGLNMRGYSFRTSWDNSIQENLVNQNTGGAINAQIEFQRLIPIKFNKLKKYVNLDLYFFGDVGSISKIVAIDRWLRNTSPILADAGFGTALHLTKFRIFQKVGPLTFRFDIPFYLSHPALEDNGEHVKFRYLIGIQQAF